MDNALPYSLQTWRLGAVTLESAVCPSGAPVALERHRHPEHQFILPSDGHSAVYTHGRRERLMGGRLAVIEAGISHSVAPLEAGDAPASALMLYLPMQSEDDGEAQKRPPSFAVLLGNPAIEAAFLRVHRAAAQGAAALEQDGRLAEFVAAASWQAQGYGREPAAVRTTREYLQAHFAENVSLAELARVASLAPNHLNAVFSQAVGLPPHAYQTRLRLARARRLLSDGVSVGETALQTGFADQSHLTRAFKRRYGMPPGRYARES